MSALLRVALLGFDTFERATITAAFVQAGKRWPAYVLVPDLDASDLLLADAEHMAAVRLVLATERLADTVFVGRTQAMAVAGAAAWVTRPIDPAHLLREFDALLAHRSQQQPGAPAQPSASASESAQVDQGMNGARSTQALNGTTRGTAGAQGSAAGDRAPLALVVDDSETARHGLAQRLQQWGFNVEQAAHSGQALALLSRRSFDSVFIDVNLGPASALDGFALCRRLKRQAPLGLRPPLWVALVTALNSPTDRVRGTLAGCDAYLTKPVDNDELARVLWVQGWAPPPPRLHSAPPATL